MNTSIKLRRRARVRATLHGTASRPRLSVHVSNQHVLAQLIDDDAHVTLAFSSSTVKALDAKTMTAKAQKVGADIAEKAKKHKINTVIFDRGERIYHGRVRALAEAARASGLKF